MCHDECKRMDDYTYLQLFLVSLGDLPGKFSLFVLSIYWHFPLTFLGYIHNVLKYLHTVEKEITVKLHAKRKHSNTKKDMGIIL